MLRWKLRGPDSSEKYGNVIIDLVNLQILVVANNSQCYMYILYMVISCILQAF